MRKYRVCRNRTPGSGQEITGWAPFCDKLQNRNLGEVARKEPKKLQFHNGFGILLKMKPLGMFLSVVNWESELNNIAGDYRLTENDLLTLFLMGAV